MTLTSTANDAQLQLFLHGGRVKLRLQPASSAPDHTSSVVSLIIMFVYNA